MNSLKILNICLSYKKIFTCRTINSKVKPKSIELNQNNKNEIKKKTLLLDFDGVIFDNPAANNIIIDKVNKFVASKLEHIPQNNIKEINKNLYATYGHTLLGLDAHYNIKVSIKEFNDYIYDDDTFIKIAKIKQDFIIKFRAEQTKILNHQF